MEWIEVLKAALIGIIQGITEWLPVSSTGHMILADEFVKLNVSKDFMEMFLVVIQFGSILAVLFLYFHKLNPFSPKKSNQQKRDTWTLWFKVAVATVPAGIVGLLLDDVIHDLFYKPVPVAIALIVYGILFIWLENRNKRPKINELNDLTYQTALLIGMFQILALIPGTSRSGSTILGAVFLGASRYVSAEFSFFLAIPVMLGASGMKLAKYFLVDGGTFGANEWGIMLTGLLVAFVVSVLAIKFLMNFIKKHDFKPFGYYRILLGLVVLLYFVFVR